MKCPDINGEIIQLSQVGGGAEIDAEDERVCVLCPEDPQNPHRGPGQAPRERGRGTTHREEGQDKGKSPIHPYCHTVDLHSPYTHSTNPILQVWLILFSDILLIAQRRRGTVLMCLEPAIPLDTLRADDFNCSEGIYYTSQYDV